MNMMLEQINSMGQSFVEFAWPMLAQSSVLIVILLLVDFLLRKRVRAVFRYWLWMLVLLKLILPSSLSLPVSVGYWFGDELANVKVSDLAVSVNPADMPQAAESVPVEVGIEAPAATPREAVEPAVSETVSSEAVSAAVTWQGVVFLAWLAVVAAMALLLLQRAIFVIGFVAQARDADSSMNDAFEYCRGRMRIKGKVGLKVSANATSPAVCGLFRPVVLLPENLGPKLEPSGLRAVLMHELAHIKRGDLWVNLAQTLLQIVYFYNPLLWLANAVIRRVREQAVDEMVQVAMGEKARQYPQTLVDVAKLAFKRPALSLRLIGVVESKSALKGRIKRMLNRPIPKSAKLGIVGLITVLIIGALLLPMAKAERAAVQVEGEEGWVVQVEDRNRQAEDEIKQITVQAKVFSVKSNADAVRDFLANKLKLNSVSTDKPWLEPVTLTDTDVGDFSKWIELQADTSMLASPKVTVFDGEKAEMQVTNRAEYVTSYEDGKPKKEEFVTGVKFSFTPELQKDEKLVVLKIDFNQTELAEVVKKTDESGNELNIPIINTRSVGTTVAVPEGKSALIPVAGLQRPGTNGEMIQQTIYLLVRADVEVEGEEEPGRISIADSGNMKRFYSVRGWDEILTGVVVYGSRYGDSYSLDEKFKMWVCDANFNVIREFEYDYGLFKKGEPDEVQLKIEPTKVSASYAVCLGFDSNERKGVYVYYNKRTAVVRDKRGSLSYIGLPGRGFREFDKGEWRIRFLTMVVIPDEFVGGWKGQALRPSSGDAGIDEEVTEIWVPVSYDIVDRDGIVTGKVGQAEIIDGKLVNISKSHIQTCGMGLTYGGRYAVYGSLKGNIGGQSTDGAYFQSIFNLKDGRLVGQIGTIIKNQNGENEPFVLDKMLLERVIWNEQVSSGTGKNTQKLDVQVEGEDERVEGEGVGGEGWSDAAVYERLKRTADVSELTAEMAFGEALEVLKESVEPPLQIIVLWRDLYDNADIEKTTPINMDGVSGIRLGTALKLLLKSVSGGFAELGYVVDGGAIVIATKESLPHKLETRVYDTSDVLSRPADYYAQPRER